MKRLFSGRVASVMEGLLSASVVGGPFLQWTMFWKDWPKHNFLQTFEHLKAFLDDMVYHTVYQSAYSRLQGCLALGVYCQEALSYTFSGIELWSGRRCQVLFFCIYVRWLSFETLPSLGWAWNHGYKRWETELKNIWFFDKNSKAQKNKIKTLVKKSTMTPREVCVKHPITELKTVLLELLTAG